ncbi:hypothetical protein GCM10010302_10600 [Streptomyces polychromogenes]|uniref:Uncharacterized protein n=1 Tax=Streptomyces polychromogenes TaxID=67342 RepID=A0ABP3ER78_9ACTN
MSGPGGVGCRECEGKGEPGLRTASTDRVTCWGSRGCRTEESTVPTSQDCTVASHLAVAHLVAAVVREEPVLPAVGRHEPPRAAPA